MTSAARRALGVVVIGAMALAIALAVAGLLTEAPRGPASSSYAVGHRGASGFAQLLERAGHAVRQQRVPVDLERLPGSATAIVLAGDVPAPEEVASLERFVARGGRLVVASTGSHDAWLAELIDEPLRRSGSLLVCHPLAAVPETVGVEEVESTGAAGFTGPTGAVPIIGCGDDALAVVKAHGAGRVVAVADPASFQNFLLDVRDNAAFALAAAGGVDREVVFLEHLHGFESPNGLAALPWRGLAAGGVLALAAGAAVLTRRGPGARPTAPDRRQAPRQHELALAATLDGRAAADLAPLAQQAARRALTRAGRLPADAPDDDVLVAAARADVAPGDAVLIVDGAPDRPTLLAATRALEQLTDPTQQGPRHG